MYSKESVTICYGVGGCQNLFVHETQFLAARNRGTLRLSWQHYRTRVAEADCCANITLTAYNVRVSEIYFVQIYL
jgi:hypothetical protein